MSLKPRLLVLSDLWGNPQNDWLAVYQKVLSPHFDWQYYDSPLLAGIAASVSAEKDRHQGFVAGGIDRAVLQLLQSETSPVYVLAFSIGGTIAWKAALAGWSIKGLYAVCATRLRYETAVPNIPIQLIYGSEDIYAPAPEWFEEKKLSWKILADASHSLYRAPDWTTALTKDVLAFFVK